MLDFFRNLFDTSDFPARWSCGDWSQVHGWTHIVADLATFGAYFTIPIVILTFMLRRRFAFPSLGWLFAIFILSCGTVHLIEATIFWQPWYRLSAAVKVVTAIVSWATVVALVKIFPHARKLPELAAINASLEKENAQRRQAEEQLRARNEELDRFAYVASHDLKAPLRGIGMLARWVEEDSEGAIPDASKDHLAVLRNRVRRLESYLEDLMKYSQAGRNETRPEPVDVAEVTRNVLEMLELPAGMSVSVQDDLPVVVAQRVPLEHVLANLISNAAKHHDRPHGRIRIGGRTVDGVPEYWVEDDGPGIPHEFRERVFGIFQTLRPRDEVEGSGMGLPIVKKTVESRGGTVRIEDAEGERGTRVVFTWPQPAPPAALPTEEVRV